VSAFVHTLLCVHYLLCVHTIGYCILIIYRCMHDIPFFHMLSFHYNQLPGGYGDSVSIFVITHLLNCP